MNPSENPGEYRNPLPTKTPSMTVAAILQWLELEIEYVQQMRNVAENEMQDTILLAVQVHLRDMAQQLTDATLRSLDEDSKK